MPYAPGLDGLRAIAVIAVLLYHARDLTGLPAVLRPASGFLGVEVFFVISGYLITALLLADQARNGAIQLVDFWARRARRLLPALYLLLGIVLVVTLARGETLATLVDELVAGVLYVSNWLLITQDSSYFESTERPSLLRHLWSLAVEEQFYLLWPVLVIVGLRWLGHGPLFVLTVAAAVASSAVGWVLFDQLDPYSDVTAIYYRTDARAAGLLIGAAAAFIWRPWRHHTFVAMSARPIRWAADAVGLGALVAVIWAQYAFSDQLVDWDAQRRLYQGGFLLASIPTIVLIGVVVMPGSQLGRALGTPLLRWIGTRSYGLYLWHWPIYQLTRPRVDIAVDGWTGLVLRLAITVLLAELSYRFVEAPVRERRFRATLAGVARLPSMPRPVGVAASAAMAVAVTSLVFTFAATDRGATTGDRAALTANVPAETFAPASMIAPEQEPSPVDAAAGPPLAVVADDAPTSIAPPPVAVGFSPPFVPDVTAAPVSSLAPPPQPPSATASSFVASVAEPDITEEAPLPADSISVPAPQHAQTATMTVVGDSVVLGASTELVKIGDGVSVYGQVGRQWYQITTELRTLAEQGLLGEIVVIQLGNNGTLTPEIFDEVISVLPDAEFVLFVNVRVPRPWEGDVNAEIAAGVARHAPRARLADWHAVSNEHPEFFLPDGVHLELPGSEALRQLIEDAVAG